MPADVNAPRRYRKGESFEDVVEEGMDGVEVGSSGEAVKEGALGSRRMEREQSESTAVLSP